MHSELKCLFLWVFWHIHFGHHVTQRNLHIWAKHSVLIRTIGERQPSLLDLKNSNINQVIVLLIDQKKSVSSSNDQEICRFRWDFWEGGVGSLYNCKSCFISCSKLSWVDTTVKFKGSNLSFCHHCPLTGRRFTQVHSLTLLVFPVA